MSDEEMARIPAFPSPTALAELKMQEMPPHLRREDAKPHTDENSDR
jgi:hypothetical protein